MVSQISLPNSVGKSEELINSILDLTEMDHIIDRIEEESNCSEVSDVESLDNIPEFTQCPFSRYTSESDLTIYNEDDDVIDDVDADDTDSVSNMLTPSFCSLPNKSILSLSTHSLQNIDKQEELENETIENRKLSNYLDVETNEHNLNTFWTKNNINNKKNKNNPKMILERCLASNSAVSFTSSENMVQNNNKAQSQISEKTAALLLSPENLKKSYQTGMSRSFTFSHNLIQDFEKLYIAKAGNSQSDDLLSRWLN